MIADFDGTKKSENNFFGNLNGKLLLFCKSHGFFIRFERRIVVMSGRGKLLIRMTRKKAGWKKCNDKSSLFYQEKW